MNPSIKLYPAPQKYTALKGSLSPDIDPSSLEIPVVKPSGLSEQEYRILINPDGIEIHADTDVAAFHAGQTLKQIFAQCDNTLPCMEIHDWPDIATRGLMLDVSRCKVPTMETIFNLVDWMASIKLNQFQLYIEHTFAFPGHDIVWEEASPFTAEEIHDLDQYCSDRYIELVPNLNSFGHMERWLRHEPYKHLAECPDGFYSPLHGEQFEHGTTLYPDAEAAKFIGPLYDSYLPAFKSSLFNVGGDEPWELGMGRSKERVEQLGKGRVYLNFMKEIHQMVTERGHQMMCWADILMDHPEIIPEVPEGIIPVIWGYDAAHPFDEHCAEVSKSSSNFHVAPGNNTWNSLTCRLNEAIANMNNAARSALKHGATGYLITTWGDNGNHQPWITLLPGILQGACSAWAVGNNKICNLEKYFSNHYFDTPLLGRILINMGRIEDSLPHPFPNHLSGWSPTHLYLFKEEKRLRDLLTSENTIPSNEALQAFMKHCEELEASIPESLESPTDTIAAREMRLGLAMARLGARRAGRVFHNWEDSTWEEDLDDIQNEYHDVWLLRARPGGLPESIGYLEKVRQNNPLLGV